MNSCCNVCQKNKRQNQMTFGELVTPAILTLIQKKHPQFNHQSQVCTNCLDYFRAEYVEDILETERGELSAIEQEVIESFRDHELFSENLNIQFEGKRTIGERIADKIAVFGGSWTFIIFFSVFIFLWIGFNATSYLMDKPFDPFPFILLNLALSFLAAVQAPVIMMSQNRQQKRDRMKSEFEYGVNLKAELEIRHLHRKMDQLLSQQWRRLLEIQKIQIGLMREILDNKQAESSMREKAIKKIPQKLPIKKTG